MGSLSSATESSAIPGLEPQHGLPQARTSPAQPAGYRKMSKSDVVEAMRLSTPALVAEIIGQIRTMMVEETARQSRLESKGQSLLAAVGLSLTVVSSVLAKTESLWVRVPFGLFIVGALSAALCALASLRIDGYERISENTLLDTELLDRADGKESADEALSLYRRYIVPNLYDCYIKSIETNDRRANWVAKGQVSFALGMVLVGVGAMIMVFTGAKL